MSDQKLMQILQFTRKDLEANRERKFSERQTEQFPPPEPPGCTGRWGFRLTISVVISGVIAFGALGSLLSTSALFMYWEQSILASLVAFVIMLVIMLFAMAQTPVTERFFASPQPKIMHTDARMRLFNEGGVMQLRLGQMQLDITPEQFEALTAYRKLNRDLLYRVYYAQPGLIFLSMEGTPGRDASQANDA